MFSAASTERGSSGWGSDTACDGVLKVMHVQMCRRGLNGSEVMGCGQAGDVLHGLVQRHSAPIRWEPTEVELASGHLHPACRPLRLPGGSWPVSPGS